MKSRDILIDQYDDAVFALLMDEYAEDAGEALLAKFQEDMDAGLVPEPGDALDERCVDIIEEEFRSRRHRAWLKDICRWLIRLIFAIFFLVGLLLRTAWDIWQEHRARNSWAAREAARADSTDEDPPIFLTP